MRRFEIPAGLPPYDSLSVPFPSDRWWANVAVEGLRNVAIRDGLLSAEALYGDQWCPIGLDLSTGEYVQGAVSEWPL